MRLILGPELAEQISFENWLDKNAPEQLEAYMNMTKNEETKDDAGTGLNKGPSMANFDSKKYSLGKRLATNNLERI